MCVDAQYCHPFQRVKISSGTTTLYDVNESSRLNTMLFLSQVDSNDISAYEASMIGDGNLSARNAWGATVKEYMINFLPENTAFRRFGLMCLETISPVIVEFWTLPSAEFLYSADGDATTTYSMSNIEMHMEYIFSPSVFNVFKKPVKCSCKDYTYAYQAIQDAVTQVRVASSRTSLNGVMLVMRDSTIDSLVTTINKYSIWNANGLLTLNALVNQQKFFDQDLATYNEFFISFVTTRKTCNFYDFCHVKCFFIRNTIFIGTGTFQGHHPLWD